MVMRQFTIHEFSNEHFYEVLQILTDTILERGMVYR
jgi:hypothetical protein